VILRDGVADQRIQARFGKLRLALVKPDPGSIEQSLNL
jgi:hypothetical protein